MEHRVQIERLGSKPTDSGLQSLVPPLRPEPAERAWGFPRSRVPARERLIVALDVPAVHDAVRLVDALASAVTWFKVGSELFTAAGPQAVAAVRERGKRVFLDLKFHDIPRTVASAVDAAVRLGAEMINLHVAAGEDAMRLAAQTVTTRSQPRSLLLGVTRLTSEQESPELLAAVVDAAARAKWCGLDGVIASARETAAIKAACGREFVVVTPGIRPAGAPSGDQRRVTTPADAVRAGADFLVVGRPVLSAADPVAVVARMVQEMEAAIGKS